jgi:hypothetical protein
MRAAKKSNEPRRSFEEQFARDYPVRLDLAGILFVDAGRRIDHGSLSLKELRIHLQAHRTRVDAAAVAVGDSKLASAWADVIQGVGGLEAFFGATVTDFVVADVLLVAAAEAYVNSIATHVLPKSAWKQFETLSPVGKWLFLPRLMKLKWAPELDKGCLQQFAELVTRRNRVVHPRVVQVAGAVDVELFLQELRLDEKLARNGQQSVRDLIRELSLSWRGAYGPNWLQPTSAIDHPPCFVVGDAFVAMRLGRPGDRSDSERQPPLRKAPRSKQRHRPSGKR